MAGGVFHTLVAGAAWPLVVAAGMLHRSVTGHQGVLHVVVDGGGDAASTSVWLRLLDLARDDAGLDVVLLELRAPPGGYATCGDLRRVIARLRACGKRVVAWVESPGNGTLWIGAACDELVVAPTADVGLTGVGTELQFVARALERLGLAPDLEAAGAYKSFGEPFTRTYASAENREALHGVLQAWQDALIDGLARDRGLERDVVRAAMDRAPLAADEAVALGLVDRAAYLDEVRSELEDASDGAHVVAWRGWALRQALLRRLHRIGHADRVAVVHLEGAIVLDDDSARTLVRARQVVPVLEALAKDDDVRAVVLAVSSPGGSAFASDLIWRAVDQLGQAKPVVAAYGDVAASGGVYLAASAAEIVARPESLTGSIGVVGGKLVAQEALRKVGVVVEPVALGPQALALSPARPFDTAQRERFRAMLQRTYDGFVERVARGRGQDVEAVEPHCRGRVWSGRDAHRLGLVDAEGELGDAVGRAAELAGLARGTWYRDDVVLRPPQSLADVALSVVRRQTPGLGAEAWSWVVRSVGGPSSAEWLRLVADHPGEPLALWPIPVEPPRR